MIESESELTRQQIVKVFERFLAVFQERFRSKSLILIEDEEIRVLVEE